MSKTLVIHHADADGYGAAWAAGKKLGDSARYFPINYKEPLPKKLEYNIFMLDFSLPRKEMIRMKSMCPGFVCIDHHKTAKDACEGLDFCIFDMDKSGCELAWEYFHPNTPIPLLLQYIGDRDIWKFAMPHSKVINAAIMSYDFTPENFDELNARLTDDFDTLLKEGEAIERAKQQYIKMQSKYATKTSLPSDFGKFEGKECIVVNAPYANCSDLLHSLVAEHKLPAVSYFCRADGTWQYSFRSNEAIGPISDWAKQLGGGGHPMAAGAETDTLVFNRRCLDCGGLHDFT